MNVAELEKVLALMKSFKVASLKFMGIEVILEKDFAPEAARQGNNMSRPKPASLDDDPFTYGGPDAEVPGYARES